MKRAAVAWLFFACVALGALYQAAELPFGRANAPGAGFFPIVLAALLGVIALIGLFAALRGGVRSNGDAGRLLWSKILSTVAALLVFASIFEYAGYLLTTFVFIAFSLRIVERKSWIQAGAVALSASLVSYIIFGLLLGAPLPPGLLSD